MLAVSESLRDGYVVRVYGSPERRSDRLATPERWLEHFGTRAMGSVELAGWLSPDTGLASPPEAGNFIGL